jgi:hypothetical protein
MRWLLKGIVFNLLEEVVIARHGEEAWDGLLDKAGVTGSYTSLGSYPDEEILALVMAGSEALAMPPNDVLRWFGREAMPRLAVHYPAFFAPHATTRSFVSSVNSIIHPEVRKLYTGAGCPHFHFEDSHDGALLLGYNSPRRLCALAHGFIEGAADYFGETVTVEHPSCMHDGDERCQLAIYTMAAGAKITGDAA